MGQSWLWRAAVLIAPLLTASAVRPAPLEAYGKLPFITDAAISPDGKLVAYSVTDGEKRSIGIRDLETHQIVGGLRAGTDKIRSIQWAGSHHLIVTASVTGYVAEVISPREEWYLAVDFDLTRKRQAGLLSNAYHTKDHATLNAVEAQPQIRIIGGKPFAFVEGTVFIEGQGRLGLFRIDLDHEDRAFLLDSGFPHTLGYLVDAKGNPLAESEYDARQSRWLLKTWKGHWSEVTREQAQIERPDLLGLGRDGASVAVAFDGEKGGELRELSPDGAAWGEPEPNPDDLIWDPATYRLIGEVTLDGDERRYTFYDPKDQAAWNAILHAYPGQAVTLESFSDDHRKFIVRVDSPTEGPAYALVDLNAHRGDWVGDEYDSLKAADIGEKRPIDFKARDGLDLHGYITLPPGKTAKNLPLVVLPHGGPEARDEPGFDWWAQALASQGYAVLQVNFLGSSGYGWDFIAKGFGEWGRKMQTDLSDGVRHLAGEGMIDPRRVCIVGASYGGYAALAGATIDTGVYRCAASVAGIGDLRQMIEWDKSRAGDQGAPGKRYQLRYMGAEDRLADISPIFHVDRVTIPVLLVHGKDDTVVPYEQSQMMADALRKAGKDVQMVTLEREDHHLSRGATRLQMLEAVVAFLEKNNPPG
jgi:dienelactone hydrolase